MKTQTIIGVALVGVLAYLIWKNQQPKPTVNAIGSRKKKKRKKTRIGNIGGAYGSSSYSSATDFGTYSR